jgi:5-oxoprolinase (ATP-hydrolysing)
MESGANGACGDQYLERADGERVRMESTFSIHCAPGDRFTVETPGGGGFGA